MRPIQSTTDRAAEAIHRLQKFNASVATWTNVYQQTLRSLAGYKRRLRELRTWDKPLVDRNNDPSGQWDEWAAKIEALLGLINELR
jgi:FtsZ-binding cell division protein ZapB